MTGRVGGHREVKFPILPDDRPSAATKPESDTHNPLVIQRQLWRDACTIKDKIRDLGEDEPGFHGDLQVLLGTLRRMVPKVERLIAQAEDFRS
jgi:hypothetical protein